jgi:hypothetical protein
MGLKKKLENEQSLSSQASEARESDKGAGPGTGSGWSDGTKMRATLSSDLNKAV